MHCRDKVRWLPSRRRSRAAADSCQRAAAERGGRRARVAVGACPQARCAHPERVGSRRPRRRRGVGGRVGTGRRCARGRRVEAARGGDTCDEEGGRGGGGDSRPREHAPPRRVTALRRAAATAGCCRWWILIALCAQLARSSGPGGWATPRPSLPRPSVRVRATLTVAAQLATPRQWRPAGSLDSFVIGQRIVLNNLKTPLIGQHRSCTPTSRVAVRGQGGHMRSWPPCQQGTSFLAR